MSSIVSLRVAVIAAVVLLGRPPDAAAVTDPLVDEQWALEQIGAPSAWGSATGAGVRIGIVDTGIDLGHEDLAAQVVAHTNCVGSGGDPEQCRGPAEDLRGHGTHVAGIAAAVAGNGKGIAGVSPGAELVVARVLSASGAGTMEDINAGIRWVVDHGARVVNLSLGDPNFVITSLLGTNLRDGIEYAWARGAVPVLASGNMNPLGLGLLGSSEYGDLPAIVVGATTPEGGLASYSSPLGNARWSIVAPGGAGGGGGPAGGDRERDVLSTFWAPNRDDAYAALAGTSMAAPHVAGAVALLLGEGTTPLGAVERLLDTAEPLPSCRCAGRLDAAGAVHGP